MNSILKEIIERSSIKVHGLNNIPFGCPSIFCANHSCLMDIFYLPSVLPKNTVNLISSRLIYKNEYPRKDIINASILSLPIEAHGGSIYSNMCLKWATKVISEGFSCVIFPEGAYIEQSNNVYRGRTGAIRILAELVLEYNITPYLIPVSIKYNSNIKELDDYLSFGNNVDIYFNKPINYEKLFLGKFKNLSKIEKNLVLHEIMDECMKVVANAINKNYINDYIVLRSKGNVIYSDGSVQDVIKAQAQYYVKKYDLELEKRFLDIISQKQI